MKEALYPQNKNTSLPEVSSRILNYWKKNNIFRKSIETRSKDRSFNFYEGPPGANGAPGIHHIFSRALKDIFCRYKTLKGYRVERQAGWDTHGLPVELQVEKTLGITKDDIGKKISIEEYNLKCRETVLEFKEKWDDITERIGYWADLENPYITFERDYMESVWWILSDIYKKDLLYKGYTIQPYSPAAGTGLSTHELNIPGCYKEVKDTTVVAQFKRENTTDEYFLAWTTTPWTLPANSALAVGTNINYVKVETFNQYTLKRIKVILAEKALSKYFDEKNKVDILPAIQSDSNNIPWKLIDGFRGEALVGEKYEQLLPYIQPQQEAFKVISGDFITTEDGTGIVHIAPTFGADDMRAAQKAGIPPIYVKDESGKDVPIVDKAGKFVEEITDFAGRYVKSEYEDKDTLEQKDYKSIDVRIAIKLKEENKAFRVEKYEHNYPHCWRTDKPVLYYPLDSWFVKTTAIKDRLVELNKTINWYPESTGTGRFGNWLENLVDWNLSRDRFWGIPLPIWRTKDGSEEKCIGSLEQLRDEVNLSVEKGHMKNNLPEDFDLHRPYVDDLILTSQNGEPMYRETDVIDVWFDSGAMPYASLHYPFENKNEFDNKFPADFIAEGVDQTRGWFFTLHAISGLVSDSISYKNVISTGLVLDKDGNKMSKRLGNTIDPNKVIDEYGPDVVRWYMVTNANPWENLKFDLEELNKTKRRFFNTLDNTYEFFALYANIDGFVPDQRKFVFHSLHESDRWIISKLNSLIKAVDESLDNYDVTKAGRAIEAFVVNDLSNWYVRLNRKRYWNSENTDDKISAYQTLYDCLLTISKVSSSIAPFYMERLYRDLATEKDLTINESVHLTYFPDYEPDKINPSLEARMEMAQRISSLVHSLRKQYKVKVRHPLSKILIPININLQKEEIEKIKDIILTEVNIKAIEYLDSENDIIKKTAKPNFQKLGKEYGPQMKIVAEAIKKLSKDQIIEIESKGAIEIQTESEELGKITLFKDDVLISSQDIEGWAVANDKNITVAVDLNITDELRQEGVAREFVNRIQNLRKELGYDVQDKISLIVNGGELISKSIDSFRSYISREIQAAEILIDDKIDDPKTVEIEGDHVELQIEIIK